MQTRGLLAFWAVVTYLVSTGVFLWRVKLLAKPSFSQKSLSSNLQEKEEDRIPPILFWADYFPFGINEISTMRSSCFVQITKSPFCFTRDSSNWGGSQLFGGKACFVTKKKECHCFVEIKIRLKVLSKFICPSLTEELTVKGLISTQGISNTNLYFKHLPMAGQCFRIHIENVREESGDSGPGVRYQPVWHTMQTSQAAPPPCDMVPGASIEWTDVSLCTRSSLETPTLQGVTDRWDRERKAQGYKFLSRAPTIWESWRSEEWKSRARSCSWAQTETILSRIREWNELSTQARI